jgi:hypothetical protein
LGNVQWFEKYILESIRNPKGNNTHCLGRCRRMCVKYNMNIEIYVQSMYSGPVILWRSFNPTGDGELGQRCQLWMATTEQRQSQSNTAVYWDTGQVNIYNF